MDWFLRCQLNTCFPRLTSDSDGEHWLTSADVCQDCASADYGRCHPCVEEAPNYGWGKVNIASGAAEAVATPCAGAVATPSAGAVATPRTGAGNLEALAAKRNLDGSCQLWLCSACGAENLKMLAAVAAATPHAGDAAAPGAGAGPGNLEAPAAAKRDLDGSCQLWLCSAHDAENWKTLAAENNLPESFPLLVAAGCG